MADPVVPLDIEDFIEERVLESDPTFELREGSAFRDFFIKPLTLILQPLRDDIEVIRTLQSLVNFATMSEDELDSLIANIFLSRRSGSSATGTVRAYFAAPQASSVTADSSFLSVTGLRYLATETTSISAAVMAVNVDGSSYFFDIPVTAERPGAEYNIAPGNIVVAESQISGSIRITNVVQFSGGLATESNTEFYNRAQTAVTVRNIVNDRSVVTTLLDNFSFLKAVVPIGFNDPEMERAKLTVLLPGPPQHLVTIPDRGGHADIYVEGDVLESRAVTVQSGPAIIGTNSSRGEITELDYGYRRIAVTGGFFNGLRYPGNGVVDLLPNLKYTVSLKLTAAGNEYELDLISTAIANPYPAVPANQVGLANLQTDGSSVVSITDIREDIFTFDRPVVSLDSVDLLDPVSLQPTGVTLRNGETALVPPSIAADPGSAPSSALSPGSGDLHLVFKRSDGVYYQRHDSSANIVTAAVQISSEVNARNIRVVATFQENLNVFFLNFAGDLRRLQIDNTGSVVVAESTISGAGTTLEFDTYVDTFGFANVLTINDNLGQPDVYFLRVNEAGAVATAQTLLQTTSDTSSSPSGTTSVTYVPDITDNRGISGVTNGTAVFTDANATFVTDGVLAGDRFLLLSGDTLPTSEQGSYTVLTVDSEVQVTFSGGPTITASPGVTYEVVRGGAVHFACWLNDDATKNNVRVLEHDSAGAATSQHVVVSDPSDGLENTLPRVVYQTSADPAPGPGLAIMWVNNATEIKRVGVLDTLSSAVTSTTGDTQLTGLSRSFFDASNPFLATDVGKYVSITAGSGLAASDHRLYEILEFVTAGHVLLAEPVTDSTAADIEYSIVTVTGARSSLAPNSFLNPVTSMRAVVDNSNNVHIGVVETEQNSGRVFLGKFDGRARPLLRPVFLRVSASLNNRSSVTVSVDAIRQPYLVWDDFTASASTVQLSKLQAQEYAYLVNDPGYSFSPREDASVLLDPTLVGQALRFNYTHSTRVPEVESFVINTVNRIVIGNYLTRHVLPAYVDVHLTYSGTGSPTADEAVTLLTDFIDSIGSQISPPSVEAVVTRSTIGDTLEKSDLVDVLYDAGADSVRIDGEIRVDESRSNGTVYTKRSIDKVTITRTARFVARSVTVTRE